MVNREAMKSFFDPVIAEIVKLVSEQTKLAEKLSGRKLDVSLLPDFHQYSLLLVKS